MSKKRSLEEVDGIGGLGGQIGESPLGHTETGTSKKDKLSQGFPFKNPEFKHSNQLLVGGQIKRKPWRTLKQILAVEQSLTWPQEAITYSSLEAPPSFRPAKKYSDISGLEALYTDPQTRLNYSTAEEFAEIRKLPGDIVQGYLALRKANTQLQ
jgi:hypothetical protein